MDADKFARSCIKYGLILDTNLFVLLVMGLRELSSVGKDKEIKKYNTDDFYVLNNIISYMHEQGGKIIVTPHILSELSRFLVHNKSGNNPHADIALEFIRNSKEEIVSKDDIANHGAIKHLGFTDLSIKQAANKLGCAIITDDGLLFDSLCLSGRSVANLSTLTQYSKAYL